MNEEKKKDSFLKKSSDAIKSAAMTVSKGSAERLRRAHQKSRVEKRRLLRDAVQAEKTAQKSQPRTVIKHLDNEDILLTNNPHCALPSHYFAAALARAESQKNSSIETAVPQVRARSLLTVETWSGRTVVSMESIE